MSAIDVPVMTGMMVVCYSAGDVILLCYKCAFIQQALQEHIRLDGRAFDAFRPLELTFGDEYGVADVQLGKTRYNFDIQPKQKSAKRV